MAKIATGNTKPEGGGNSITVQGDYHLVVLNVLDTSGRTDGQKPFVEVTFQALGGPDPSQVGKTHKETFYLTEKALGRVLEFACAVGLYNKKQWKADQESNAEVDIDFNAAQGRQLCAPILMQESTTEEGKKKWGDRKFSSMGFTFWAVGDPEADHVHKDAAYIGMFQGRLPTRDGGTRTPPVGGSAPPKPQTPPQEPPKTGGTADFF